MSGFEIIELATEQTPNVSVEDSDEKWQKLVLYYLARLKGLCDWRSRTKPNPKIHLKKYSSQELETRIIDKVTNKSMARLRKQNYLDLNGIGCYMAAGYEEGKQQAVKIISRSLKYGVMTGILLKRGNCYRVAPEYLGVPVQKKKNVTCNLHKKKCEKYFPHRRLSVKCVKTNVRKKDNKKTSKEKKRILNKYSSIELIKSNISMVRGKKRKRALNNNYVKKKKFNSITSIKANKGTKRNYRDDSDDEKNSLNCKKNKRSSDTNVNLNESSNTTTFQSLSRSLTPIDDRHNKRDVRAKRTRVKIQKPNNYVPPLKKPRTKSQSKSLSHHTDDDDDNKVIDVINTQNKSHTNKVINKFRMPRPRRYSDVMSSMSSSSLSSSCTCYDDELNQVVKRTRRK